MIYDSLFGIPTDYVHTHFLCTYTCSKVNAVLITTFIELSLKGEIQW